MHPPSRSTTRSMFAMSRSTGAMVSIVSAVSAGDVIARDDRHDDRRRPVARQSTDGVLVHHEPMVPGQHVAHIDHGPGQRQDFAAVQRSCGARRNERGQ
jgi:hypothetical protein